ncbi:MAG: hypothetical protein K0S32_283 [Bacteroidetes bacterium]|nr:hypothetical protein [Bacteroidota bacterium]
MLGLVLGTGMWAQSDRLAKPQGINCGGFVQTDNSPSTQALVCTATSSDYTNKYSKQSTYVPTTNDPVITIKITFHVFNKTNGTGSWPNTPMGIANLTQIANWIHNGYDRYSDPRNANYTVPGFVPPPFISDSKVNYELTNIYFYNDDNLNVAAVSSTYNDTHIFNAITAADPARLNEGLPIIFNNGYYLGAAGYASANSNGPFVHTFVVAPPMGLWWCGEHLRHEIGHTCGWGHTYGTSCCPDAPCATPDFLSDLFPINNPNCPTGTNPCNVCYENGSTICTNNVMSGGGCLGMGWITPLQMGRRIRNLHLAPGTGGNGLRKFAKEMTSSYQAPWNITANETWDFDIQMYRDIIVKPGATLTIKCKVGMANAGRIIVERGARLIIDGGEIYSWCKGWQGIQVWGTSSIRQLIGSNGLSTDQGIVRIINQGTVKDADNAITTIKYDENGNWDWGGYTGGIIQCDGAQFINNIKAIQYLSYQNYNPTYTTIIANIGYIRNSLFETNDVLKMAGNPDPNVFISMWEVRGIQYRGNTYQNTRSPLPAIDKRGSGFYSIDASYTVDRYQVCSLWGPNGCAAYSTNNPSTFNNLHYGVQVQNGVPASNVIVNNNDFTNCNRSIYIGGTYYTVATNNRINVGQGLNSIPFLPYGIYFENSSAYDISNNTIWTTQTSNYNLSLATGICINKSNGLNNLVYRNNINMMGAGSTVYGDNQGTNPGDGLKFKCNQYGQGVNGLNYTDLYMAWDATLGYNGRIDKAQGSTSGGANNFFSHTNNSNPALMSDYMDNGFFGSPGAANSIQYYYNPVSGSWTQPFYYDNSLFVNSPLSTGYVSSMCPAVLGGGSGSGSGSSQKTMPSDIKQVIAEKNTRIAELLKKAETDNSSAITSELSELNHEKGVMIDQMIRTMLEQESDENNILEIMKTDDRPDAKYHLLAAYLSYNKLSEAGQLLSTIETKDEYVNYMAIQKLLLQSKKNGASINDMKKDGQLQSVIASVLRNQADVAYPSALALNKLINDGRHFEFIDLPSQAKTSPKPANNNWSASEMKSFKLYPNPSKEYTNLYFDTRGLTNTTEVMVMDITGKIVIQQQLSTGTSTHVLNTKELKSGLYLVKITEGNKTIGSQKLIIE